MIDHIIRPLTLLIVVKIRFGKSDIFESSELNCEYLTRLLASSLLSNFLKMKLFFSSKPTRNIYYVYGAARHTLKRYAERYNTLIMCVSLFRFWHTLRNVRALFVVNHGIKAD